MNKTNKIVSISFGLFLLSLTQTALLCDDFDGPRTYSSISMFLTGGFCILGGGLMEWIVWLANPIYFFAVTLFLRNSNKAKLLSIIASSLAFSFLFWNNILAAEDGRTATIKSFKFGYYLWLASFIVLSIGIIRTNKKAKELPKTTRE